MQLWLYFVHTVAKMALYNNNIYNNYELFIICTKSEVRLNDFIATGRNT